MTVPYFVETQHICRIAENYRHVFVFLPAKAQIQKVKLSLKVFEFGRRYAFIVPQRKRHLERCRVYYMSKISTNRLKIKISFTY